MKLCLTSGEVLTITKNVKFIFELDGLKDSSPATVSRCGIVCILFPPPSCELFSLNISDMTPEASEWSPLARAWIAANPARALWLPYFDWLVPLILIYLRSYCYVLIQLPQASIVCLFEYHDGIILMARTGCCCSGYFRRSVFEMGWHFN